MATQGSSHTLRFPSLCSFNACLANALGKWASRPSHNASRMRFRSALAIQTVSVLHGKLFIS